MFRTFTNNNNNNKTYFVNELLPQRFNGTNQNAGFREFCPHLDRKAFERMKLVAQW